MEALNVALFALAAIVLLDAIYCIAMRLARWAPVIAVGVLIGWLAHRQGTEPLEALGLAILACLAARHMLCTRRG